MPEGYVEAMAGFFHGMLPTLTESFGGYETAELNEAAAKVHDKLTAFIQAALEFEIEKRVAGTDWSDLEDL